MTELAERLRLETVRPALRSLEPLVPWTQAAENLVLATAAHESGGFRYRRQTGGGPARGLFQMEQVTFRDLYDRYLAGHPRLKMLIDTLWTPDGSPGSGADPWPQVETNDQFAAAMCRIRYWASPAKINFDPRDVFEMSRCWSQFYNTRRDPRLEAEFVANYRRYVEDVIGKGEA